MYILPHVIVNNANKTHWVTQMKDMKVEGANWKVERDVQELERNKNLKILFIIH